MSQPQFTEDLEMHKVPGSLQQACQCSAMINIESLRTPRDRGERSVANNRISSSREPPRALEALQSTFEPMGKLESPLSHQGSPLICLENGRSLDVHEEQDNLPTNPRPIESEGSILARNTHPRTLSRSPRNLERSRNLAFEAARRVQESASLQDNQRNLTASPSLMFEPSPAILESLESIESIESIETSGNDQAKQMGATPPSAMSQKQTHFNLEKLTNIQQVLHPYQHQRAPTATDRTLNTVHAHFHADSHTHLHKHPDNYRNCGNLDGTEGLIGLQQHQRQHTHHHYVASKGAAGHHHPVNPLHHSHGPQALTGYQHGNLTTNLSNHVHATSGAGVDVAAATGSLSINHTTRPASATNPSSSSSSCISTSSSHHQPNPIVSGGASAGYRSNSTPPSSHSCIGTTTGLTPHHSSNTGYPTGEHHSTPSALSRASSNSSMMNHGGSPATHRHPVNGTGTGIGIGIGIGTGTNSPSTTPLAAHNHASTSVNLIGHSNLNHHRVSSATSCEPSSSSSNARTHSRLEHIHDHHHHQLQPAHTLRPAHFETPTRTRERPPSSAEHQHTHHHGHVYNHGHPPLGQSNDNKNATSIAVDSIQVSTPSKSKCQCHVVQQESAMSKRGGGGGGGGEEPVSDGVIQVTSRTHQPPALPPRPPPRPTRRYETTSADQQHTAEGGCCKKYVVLCCLCGGLSAAVGCLFLAVHAVLSAHTASLALFETVPSYIPGIMLIKMGLFTMLLARRKHRYGLLMKVCGSVGVVCALVCVLVTVTTTVVHMSRLQGLRECVYTARARSCTCYGAPQSKDDPGVLFEGTPHCEAVHGALYACLRALFGVSVAGILACIFSCMLVYQLSSHEKKKMYWEQLELRCRSLYGQGGAVGAAGTSCGCCNDCGGASPWWAQTPGNLYTPNPDLAPARRWRLPWSRSRGPAPSPDSNYGFHTQARQVATNPESVAGPYSVVNAQTTSPYSVINGQTGPYTTGTASYSVLEAPVQLWGPPPPYSDPNSPARRSQLTEQRARTVKRIENFDSFDSTEEHRARSSKRPSADNYENAEEISNSTDNEVGNEGTMKGRRARKPLKGVENGAFQQEANAAPKQSESELYFGDVSSCCGPESSFYDLAVEKEGGMQSQGVDYLAARLGKRQLSKRSRMPLPLPADGISVEMPSDNYANSDESRNGRGSGPFLAPDAQYEVIQQTQYSYYATKDTSEGELQEDTATAAAAAAAAVTAAVTTGNGYFSEEEAEGTTEREYRGYGDSQDEETPQCCLSDSTTLDSGWQSAEQPQSDDNVCPVNV